MDGFWRFKDYNPTHHLGNDIKSHWTEYVRNVVVMTIRRADQTQEVQNMFCRCQKSTLQLKDRPYDPYLWLLRGNILHQLGYPELALGDLWKALILCNVAHTSCIARLGAQHLHVPRFCDCISYSTALTPHLKYGDLALAQFRESFSKRKGK